MPVGWFYAVGDADHHQDQTEGEGDVAPPVDRSPSTHAALLELEVRPHRSEQAEGYGNQEDEAPFDRGQQPAEDQADEDAADAGDVVDAERQAPLVRGEGIGQDGGRVADQEGGADTLHDASGDQPDGAGFTDERIDGEDERGGRVDDEAQVVDAYPAVEVTETPQAHHQHRRHHQEAKNHPQQVEAVAGRERIEVDAPEDVRHGDEHDGGVERRQQHSYGHVGESDPLVTIVERADLGVPAGHPSRVGILNRRHPDVSLTAPVGVVPTEYFACLTTLPRRAVDSHDPARISTNPIAVPGLNCSPSTTTPRTTATAGLR